MFFTGTPKSTIFTILITALISVSITFYVSKVSSATRNEANKEENVSAENCDYKVVRNHNYKFINPILYIDKECAATNLESLKWDISSRLENYKKNNYITSASVYIKIFNSNESIDINENEKYNPGSMLKIPILIAILKMSETNPAFLNTKLLFSKMSTNNKVQSITSKSIVLGNSYSIKQLLEFMVTYSDNEAANLLAKIIDGSIIKKLFMDIGLENPDLNSKDMFMTSKNYSYFIRVLFNAGYLTNLDSEYALMLMSKSDYTNGIIKGLPLNVLVAHKFGESGNDNEKQLHESAVVYINNSPYLLTVMTKGSNREKLSNVIADISKMVYENLRK